MLERTGLVLESASLDIARVTSGLDFPGSSSFTHFFHGCANFSPIRFEGRTWAFCTKVANFPRSTPFHFRGLVLSG